MSENAPSNFETEDTIETTTTDTDSKSIAAREATVATVSSDYKVRGKKDAPTGTGVLGHNTATSGAAVGVEGVTESTDPGAAGVQGQAAKSNGATYGVEGITHSTNLSAAAVRADAPNGADGLKSTSSGGLGVDVDTSGNTGIHSTTDGSGYNAVHGINNATNGLSWGVRGDTESANSDAYGVRGNANNSQGTGKGVGGVAYGKSDGAAGVYGEANASTGATYGLDGVTQSAAIGAAGVHGEATQGSGVTYGVDGFTPSDNEEAAGVRGSTSGTSMGVLGQTYDNASNLPSLVGSTEAAGVMGRTDKSNGWGMLGWSVNHHGVLGRTDDSNDYGVFAYNSNGGYSLGVNGDADVMGTLDVANDVNATNVSASNDLSVGGHSDVTNVGLNAYLSSDYTIPDSTFTTLPFDSTTVDHFSGFDTSTGVYTVQEAGDYHVDFLIDWADGFAEGDGIEYALLINGGLLGGMSADTVAPAATDPAEHFGRTLFGLTSGDTIEVELYQSSGSDKNVWGGSNEQTFLTIHKVG